MILPTDPGGDRGLPRSPAGRSATPDAAQCPVFAFLKSDLGSVLVDRGGGDLTIRTFKTHSVGIGVIARHVLISVTME